MNDSPYEKYKEAYRRAEKKYAQTDKGKTASQRAGLKYRRKLGIGERVKCSREDCTGVHSSGKGHTSEEICEATKEKRRANERQAKRTFGTYKYKASHGLGVAGLKAYLGERTRDLTRERGILVTKLQKAEQEIERLEGILNER